MIYENQKSFKEGINVNKPLAIYFSGISLILSSQFLSIPKAQSDTQSGLCRAFLHFPIIVENYISLPSSFSVRPIDL